MPSTASKSKLKLRQKVIIILFNFKVNIKKKEVYILDQEISNDEEEKVIKRDIKKRPIK